MALFDDLIAGVNRAKDSFVSGVNTVVNSSAEAAVKSAQQAATTGVSDALNRLFDGSGFVNVVARDVRQAQFVEWLKRNWWMLAVGAVVLVFLGSRLKK